jgi:hypothetical protein
MQDLERLAAALAGDVPPAVHVAPRVLRRLREVQAATDRTLALFAAGSCVAAIAVVVVGLSLLSRMSDPLEMVFQIVPPIGL